MPDSIPLSPRSCPPPEDSPMRQLLGRLRTICTLAAFCGLLIATDRAEAQKCLHEGFKVELLFQPPDVEHPSVVACDDDGNLFIGEDPMDMRGPTTKEFDRILRVEFNPNGTVKKKTVFCENLAAVFGMVWHEGALYVMHAPHYSMFKDADGDGVAEVRKDLADGFGPAAGVMGFNDHIVTGTRLGLDGLIYVSVGDKGVPKATGSDGSTISLEGGGVIRMRPDGTQLEVFSSGTRNHLDVAMDSLDNIFTYDNTDDGLGWWTRFTHHVETGYYGYPYDYHPHADRHLPRISEHGSGSPVGAACYRDAYWPAKYRNAVFYCEWGKRKVQLFTLTKSGASFEAEMEDFLVPEDGSEFRPQDVCFSPDGNSMFVADWNYGGWVNPQVCGRVYRVTYVGEGAPKAGMMMAMGVDGARVTSQLTALSNQSYSTRVQAQQALARGDERAISGASLVLSEPRTPKRAKIHAIWAQNGLLDKHKEYNPTGEWVIALSDKDADVRAQAARALGLRLATSVWAETSTTRNVRRKLEPVVKNADAIPALCKALQDADASVVLQAAVALGRIGDPAAVEPLLDALRQSDVYARFTMVQSLRAINRWESALARTSSNDPQVAQTAVLALTTVYDEAAVKVLAETVQNAVLPEVQLKALEALSEVARQGEPYTKGWWGTQPAKGKPSREKTLDWAGTPTVLAALKSALGHQSPAMRVAAAKAQLLIRDPEALTAARSMVLSDADPSVRSQIMDLLAETKDADAAPLLSQVALDGAADAKLREKAVRTLQAIGGEAASKLHKELLTKSDLAPEMALALLTGAETLKLTDVVEPVAAYLAHADLHVRRQAVVSLAAIQGADSAARIQPLLNDADAGVRKAALTSLAAIGAKVAVPEMLKQIDKSDVRSEAMIAVAKLADRRALLAYLEGLVDKNPDVRAACGVAMNSLRTVIGDDLRELHKRNELSEPIRAELGSLFATPAPVLKWSYLGAWSKETADPAFDFKSAPDLTMPVKVGERELKWQPVESTHPQGMVDASKYAETSSNVWSIVHASVESSNGGPVSWMVGSDDQSVLWINGEKVSENLSDGGWSADELKGTITIPPGKNQIWLKTGNTGGGWQFSLSIGGPDPAFAFLYENVPPQLNLTAFRNHVMNNVGNAEKGAELFFAKDGVGCVKCHSVGDRGEAKIGPNLLGVGAKYAREELIRSVLEPSNRIVSGYELTIVVTTSGQVVQGILKSETDAGVELTQVDGTVVMVPKAEIDDQQRSALSAMPNGLEKGMTLADFADIEAYLESQKQALPAAVPVQ